MRLEQEADHVVGLVLGLAWSVVRSLSPVELNTLRAVADANTLVLSWRQATLTRLRFLGLVAADSVALTMAAETALRLLDAGLLEAPAPSEGGPE